jgi:pimeloyl-ACP methyl ester carboxylesterase
MVLVDAWHENLSERMPPAWHKLEKRRTNNLKRQHTLARMGLLNRTARLFGESAATAQIQDLPGHIQAMSYKPQYFATRLAEGAARTESEAQIKTSESLGDIPLIVICQESPSQFSQLPDEQATQARQVLREMQDELVGLSSNSKLVLVEQSDHNIPLEQPAVVVDAIREVVEAIRSEGLLVGEATVI